MNNFVILKQKLNTFFFIFLKTVVTAELPLQLKLQRIVSTLTLFAGLSFLPAMAQTLFVNDNSTTGDTYTTAVGNDVSGTGSSTAPYATIAKAITVASAGYTIKVDAGTYTANFTINKNVTLMGPNTGRAGNSTRIAEAQIKDSKVTISGTAVIVFDGFHIYQTTTLTGGTIDVSNTPATIKNNIIERNCSTTGTLAVGIQTASATSAISIQRNLFTGNNAGGLAGSHKTWNSGIYCNGGSSITYDNNQFQNCRTAMNIDNMSAGVTVSNNIFGTNGTAISFGGTTGPTGSYIISGNTFTVSNTTFNLSNVATTFRLDATNNTFGTTAAASMTLTQCFSLEATIIHKGASSKNGLVTYVAGKLFKSSTTTITNNISYASTGNIIHVAGGTISEAVNVNKAVKLYGANYNVNPNTSLWAYNTSRATESSISANAITISSSNVEVNGFKVTGISSGVAAIGNTAAAAAYENVVISNNWITSNTSAVPISFGGTGSMLFNGLQITNNRIESNGGTNASGMNITKAGSYTISGNYISAANFHGIVADGYSTASITGNRISAAKFRAIQVQASYTSPQGIIVSNNNISDCQSGIYAGTNATNQTMGVQVIGNTISVNVGKLDINLAAIDVRGIKSGTSTANEVSRNTITMSGTFGSSPVGLSATSGGPATASYGIIVAGDVGSVNINSNVIDGGTVTGSASSSATNPGPGMSGIYFRNGAQEQATALTGTVVAQNNDVKGLTNSVICFNTTTITVQSIPVSFSLTVTNNSLVPSGSGYAFNTAGGGAGIAATCNWYGSATYSVASGKVLGNVTFQPFLTSGTDNDALATGFQPQSNVCNGVNLTAPSTGASSGVFSGIGQSSMTLSFTKGNGSARMVVVSKGSAISGSPVNNQSYTGNPAFGSGTALDSGYVVFNDTNARVSVTNLQPNTVYYFTIFEYNSSGTTILYGSSVKYTCSANTLQPDADGDGVADADDQYPSDQFKAFNASYPAAGFGTLMFEDLWPGKGDYDFNDLVLDYRFNTVTNADNNVVEVTYTFITRAIGGALHNGFAFQLDGVNPDKISSISGSKASGASWISLNPNGTESGQAANANILVFDDAYKLLPTQGGFSFVNVDPQAPDSGKDTTTITVKFLVNGTVPSGGALSYNDFGTSVFNPYLIIGQDRGKEVHLIDRLPSAKMNTTYFGKQQDASNVSTGKYYKTSANLPYALNISTSIPYPQEKIDISAAYLKFIEWASSGGTTSPTWYLNTTGNRDNTKLIIR